MSDGRPYDPERYSPVRPEVVLRLPESNARDFWIASILGRFLRFDGGSERLQSGKEAAGTLVTKSRAAVIRDTLQISPRRWRVLVADWKRRGLAHRCPNGNVFLFTHALPAECPACHEEILVTELPPSPRRNRGAGFGGGGTTSSAPAALPVPLRGTTSSAAPALEVPRSGTGLLHPSNRFLPRDEVGLHGSEASEEDVFQEGLS